MMGELASPTWGLGETRYTTLAALIDHLSSTSAGYIKIALKAALENDMIKAHLKDGIMPYLYAASFLSFSGREITDKGLTSVIMVLGMKPDQKLIDVLMDSGVKSHLVYIYAYYFLLAGSTEPSVDNMLQAASAIGIRPDRERAQEMHDFCISFMQK